MGVTSERRRAKILDAAGALFAKQGIAHTTVRQIADASEIKTGSLYYHFASKDEIAVAIISDYLRDMNATLAAVREQSPTPIATLREFIIVSFRYAQTHIVPLSIAYKDAPYLMTIDKREELDEHIAATRSHWYEVLAEGVAAGELSADVDANLVYSLSREAVWSTGRTSKRTTAADKAARAEAFTKLLFGGIAITPPPEGKSS